MPPKKPGGKPAAPSPRGTKAAPTKPAAAKPTAKDAPANSDKKSLLFAAFEGLVQIHPNEAKARGALVEDEEVAFDDIMFEEMTGHLVLSEAGARLLVVEEEGGVFGELSFEETTNRHQLAAAMVSKKSIVGRKASIVDPGLGARIARKKSRLDSELEAEESRLAKAAVNTSDPKAAMRADREKWLAQTVEVRALLEASQMAYDTFCFNNNGKRFESKKVADERKSLESKCDQLEKKLKKLEGLETKYHEREVKERERVRRCSNLKGVDLAVITGERSVLQKAIEIEIRRKHEEQNEILDEDMFRQMVVQSDREAFDRDLAHHEQAVRRRASELKALHGPALRAPQPPARVAKKQTKNPPREKSGDEERLHLPPISGRIGQGGPSSRRTEHTPRGCSSENQHVSPVISDIPPTSGDQDSAQRMTGSDHGETIPSAVQSDDAAVDDVDCENTDDDMESVSVEC
jgi:hypothetical protein